MRKELRRLLARRRLLSSLGVSVSLLAATSACRDEGPPSEAFFRSTFPYRLLEGRVSLSATYGEYLPPDAYDRLSDEALIRLAEEASSLAGQTGIGPTERHRDALVAAWSGRIDRAIDRLGELRLETEDRAPRIRSDLAALHLERASRQDRTLDLTRAAHHSRLAAQADPDASAPRFNLALALTELGLRLEAAEAWREYLAREGDPAWSSEGEHRLAGLSVASRSTRWADALADDEARYSGAAARGRALAEEFPFQSRRWFEEELLGDWVEAVRSRDPTTARRLEDLMTGVGEALRDRGERIVLDAVRPLRGSASAQREALAEALSAFDRGLGAYYAQSPLEAERWLREAARRLEPHGSPLAALADFFAARCLYDRDAARAYRELIRLEERLDPSRYPSLTGRVVWRLGIIDEVQKRMQSALSRYRSGTELMRIGSGDDGAAFGHVLIAGALNSIGDTERAWSEWKLALEAVSRVGMSAGIRPMLVEMSQRLLDHDLPELARPFVDELLALAEVEDHALARSDARRQRARLLGALGREREALEILGEARELAGTLPSGGARESRMRSLAFDEGLLLAKLAPDRGIRQAELALTDQRAVGYDHYRQRYLRAAAETAMRQRRPDRAREVLEEALALHEEMRSKLTDAAARAVALDRVQEMADLRLEIAIESGLGAKASLLLAERTRTPFLHDLQPSASAREPGRLEVVALQAALAPGMVVVQYGVLEREVIAWEIGADAVTLHRLPGDPSTLAGEVERFTRSVRLGRSRDDLRDSGMPLWSRLVEPLELDLEAIRLLTVVPDRALHDLPFAALPDPSDGRYLVERTAISVAPSSTLLAAALRSGAEPSGPASLLAIGEPALSPTARDRLADLPWALEEARRAAAAYAEHRLLTGAEATDEAFLDLAPRYSVVHFAGHALANPDALFRSRLFLAPTPVTSGELTLDRLFELDLSRTRLVVLSACGTLDGYRAERGNPLNLGGVLFARGVTSVVSTLWSVEDRATAELMATFHQEVARTGSPAGALRAAILATLGRGGRHSSPAHWAGFVVIGV